MPPLPPLFSFVSTSRNDDHGGDVLRRTQSYVSRLAEQAARHRVRCELILVEWNPPGGRAPLADVLDWPEGTPWFSARVITVSREVHRSLRHSIPLQMFQMIAKNVGIRRAAGDYVIATNIDIVFSDELFDFLKRAKLEDDVLYRSDRWDIPNDLQLEPSLDTLLLRAREEAIRRNLKAGTFIRQPDGSFKNFNRPTYEDNFVDPIRNELDRILNLIARDPADSERISTEIKSLRNEFIDTQRRYAAAPLLHTNGCGDFTMLSRYGWGRLRGYPEWHLFSWAIDSVLIYQAHYNGMAIEELPADGVHYHIEHDYGSGWSPEGAASLWERMDRSAIPYIAMEDFKRIVLELDDNAAKGQQTVYCDLGWGFENIVLPDLQVAAPGLPARSALTRNEGQLDENPTESMVETPVSITAADRWSVVADFEARHAEDGRQFHRFTTNGPPWGYALSWNLGRKERADEFWLQTRLRVVSGRVSFAVLNEDETAFLNQAFLNPTDGYQDLKMRVRPNARATLLVCRNAGVEEAEVEIESLFILEPAGAA